MNKEIQPYFKTHNIPILLVSSNTYIQFLSTVIISIINSASPYSNYDIIIFEYEITEKNKKKIQKLIKEKSNFSIRFISCKENIANRKFYTSLHVTIMTYARFIVLDVLKAYEKVIYLDCDIIVNKDIALLYSIDLKNDFIGAVQDSIMYGWYFDIKSDQKEYNKNKLGLSESNIYFNAGVLLFNVKLMKQYYNTTQLLSIASSDNYRWFDQDILNMICKNKVKILDNRWNVICHMKGLSYPEQNTPEEYYKKYLMALSDPWIIHYAGRVLPCYCPNVMNSEYFWYIARKSPFFYIIIYKYIISVFVNAIFPVRSKRREKLKILFQRLKK